MVDWSFTRWSGIIFLQKNTISYIYDGLQNIDFNIENWNIKFAAIRKCMFETTWALRGLHSHVSYLGKKFSLFAFELSIHCTAMDNWNEAGGYVYERTNLDKHLAQKNSQPPFILTRLSIAHLITMIRYSVEIYSVLFDFNFLSFFIFLFQVLLILYKQKVIIIIVAFVITIFCSGCTFAIFFICCFQVNMHIYVHFPLTMVAIFENVLD